MAWRDAKASRMRLMLFMASIILGIAAVVSIQLFSQNLTDNIQRHSKSLMGADFTIDSDELPNPRAQAIIDSLKPDASEINFVSMVAFPKNDGTKLVRVRGLQGEFPFYGKLDTEPVAAAISYQALGGALVDATLMLQYNLQAGDSIKIGEITLPLAGALKAIPGNSAVATSVAPLVIIPFRFIEATELLQFGSRKEYRFFFKQPNTDLLRLEEKLQPMLEAENADFDTHTRTSSRLGKRYDNVGSFLNLTAFIALLLGCVGIASSVNIYIKEKIKAIAILKCLGASRKQSFLIFLIQIAGIGILGGIIGTAIGVGLQELFPIVLKEFLPFELTISITSQPLIIGVFLGLVMSVLFALLPLLRTWYVSPLDVLRVSGDTSKQSRKASYVAIAVIVLFLYAFSFWLLKDWLFALAFIVAIMLTFGILSGIAIATMKLVKAYFPKGAGFTTRQSLLNLFRPNNQTIVLLIAIGLGTFLISTLYFTKDILLDKAEIGQTSKSVNLITLDVQPDQVDEVANTFKANDLPVLDNIPLVTMRMHSIKNVLVNTLRTDTTAQVKSWLLNHEFRTTYRANLIDSEEIIAGEWVPNQKTDEIIQVSISDNLAEDANVSLGDSIVFNVQGVLMETVIKSIRKVDWANLQPNFTVLFPSGVLENAPQFYVLTTNAPTEASSAKLQRDLVSKFPNVSVIDLRQMFTVVEDILNKVSWIINFMAFFSILTGIIVLIGSVRTSKYQRIKESVLLRTLGAKNKQILTITALEYLFLGILGSLLGILLALVSSLLLAIFVFEQPFTPSLIPFLVFLPGISLLVLGIGLSNIREVLRSSPLEVLRKSG
ncbi:putative ABC-type transport system involved in lysophospholipase L1 biosynthesis, permease component [Aequorivita sublithincola DSM 14238]|uniref:Putative ABC-type transport system involved in lysophospholipase L1 biosynthesis, permease component n=1 Tax=Aequorivita sublithincola (strain DSM 14238 / LMG 21431 / ACAM 643 / 9-3) TaxID=746697 RepID=I3YYS4_AEQSU|nr:FtsX-like permease family protein [Aequorivita sublithincola]AFL82142.1 putative ABC-type transport system involved in lysophospholipase L1 biosynthesis, permease component [Aequorivita sublithincola DSM 14238]